jgi:hypothetical protein
MYDYYYYHSSIVAFKKESFLKEQTTLVEIRKDREDTIQYDLTPSGSPTVKEISRSL